MNEKTPSDTSGIYRQQDKATSSASGKPMWKPKSLRAELSEATCPHCNATILPGFAICPHCGHSLTPGECSFCGAPMKEKQRFCTRCGQNRDGIVCPQCGTLNSRNFCRVCNAPLTPTAIKTLEEAAHDPAFIAVQKKAEELAELQAQIENYSSGETEEAPSLSEADRALLDKYADLLDAIGTYRPSAPKAASQSAPSGRKTDKPQAARTKESHQTAKPAKDAPARLSMDDLIAAYKKKASEMDAALEALVPPADFTPQQQRDYFSARKVMKVECEMRWKCNLCGALHLTPSECTEPELGGVWVTIETNIKID